ncbi:ArnT family glycosyltransferase [Oryzifoliimicrobium ureilyticus]|uniref:ArnT family glycosyltransferase n=1 Tax=Oryzifoliimicrobium ureilyticus TaxID=3113724 RepID=UPI0030762249
MSVSRGLFIILALTVFRVACLFFDRTNLFVDEAQYWLWSQHLDFGYYSKPPMIAWVLWLSTSLSGSNDIFWLRLPGPILHAATAILLMRASQSFVSSRNQGWVGVTYITLPGVAFSSVFFSTDVVLLFFVALALFAYLRLTLRPSLGGAVGFGAAVGLAFLSKYALLFLLPGGATAPYLIPRARIAIRDFLVAVVTAALTVSPNLIWNALHSNATIRHTQNIAHWGDFKIRVADGLTFFAAQFAVVGPLVFVALLWALVRLMRNKSQEDEKLLLLLSVPVVFLITLQALLGGAYANWAVTAYVAGTILAVIVFERLWPQGLRISFGINGAICLVFPFLTIFPQSLTLPNGRQIMQRYLGRAEISHHVAYLARQTGLNVIVTDSRDLNADFFYTLRSEPFRFYAPRPKAFPENYYEQEFPLPASVANEVLFVTTRPFACQADKASLVETWSPANGAYRGKAIYAYRASPSCLE